MGILISSVKIAVVGLFIYSVTLGGADARMTDKEFQYLDGYAQKYLAIPFSNAKKCGLKRTTQKLLANFEKYVSMCNPRETQLIKLEKIFENAKPDTNCKNLDKVEEVALDKIDEIQFHMGRLRQRFSMGMTCGFYFGVK